MLQQRKTAVLGVIRYTDHDAKWIGGKYEYIR